VYRPDLFSLAARMEDLFIPPEPLRNFSVPATIESTIASEDGMPDF
jgi:hypothetical protein